MSLFPAYASNEASVENTNAPPKEEAPNWLSNSSFPNIVEKPISISSSSSSEDERSTRRRKKKRKHEREKKKARNKLLSIPPEKLKEYLDDSKYYEDRKGSQNNSLIPKLMKGDAPIYSRPRKCFFEDFSQSKKKIREWRYFRRDATSIFRSDKMVKQELPSQTNEDVIPIAGNEETLTSTNKESELSKRTAEINQRVAEDPENEELWLEFVNFQDQIQQFEKYYRNSQTASIAVAEKKLAILDKALAKLPNSETLLRLKWNIKREIYDPDKLSDELFTALRQEPGNVILWEYYIRITQCSVARCTVPKVKSLYAKAIEKINFFQKDGLLSTEIHLTELFTASALFLRQSGLWEQMLLLIRLNLQLNLITSGSESYKVEVQLPEAKIRELEDEILSCGLPTFSLWLRLEKLRQRVHWYPVSSEDCEDFQRIVVPSDVTDLMRPITNPLLNLQLTVISMYLLKVPLIPCRDTVFRLLSLDNIPWHVDSAEILLSAFGSLAITQGRFRSHEESILSCVSDLVSYPQYVNEELGQEEYLEFVQKMFKKISENLPLNAETIVLVWWLRFERTLLVAGRQPLHRKKRLKSLAKDLLKEERHRNNLPLYIEYAFLEKELSENNNNCVKILETALSMYPLKKNVFHLSTSKNTITQLYRIFVEIMLVSGNRDRSLRLLIALALSIPEKEVNTDNESIKKALEEFQNITDSFDEDYFSDEVLALEHTEPQFPIEWIYCQAWFLYLTESVWSASVFLEDLLHRMPFYEKTKCIYLGTYYRELITEMLVTILHFHCEANKTSFNVLYDNLLKGIKDFPNNMLLLSTFSDLEVKSNISSPWWRIEKYLKWNDSQIAKLILILLSRRKLISVEKAHLLANEECGVTVAGTGLNNRMNALLVKLTRDSVTRQCPLIWIIYMQYCAQYQDVQKCKDVFYMALENCPWIKSLYMEGAHVLPDHVSQIQDLMIEKEIRIHITQDEIEILKDS